MFWTKIDNHTFEKIRLGGYKKYPRQKISPPKLRGLCLDGFEDVKFSGVGILGFHKLRLQGKVGRSRKSTRFPG